MPALYGVRDDHKHLSSRKIHEPLHELRTNFQRDRDRIVHSKAFRRLEYKTQVFVNHTGDNYRTRLTHSIEVSQIARTVARSLHLNEDLTETLALAHDLGHPPFGHAGERGLNRMMRSFGGFNHNEQTLRVVDVLERRYPEFNGLNLTKGTLDGLKKHDKLVNGAGHTLEALIVDICDEIAYNNHDLDDGIDSGYISLEQLDELELWHSNYKETQQRYKNTDQSVKIRYTIRNLVNMMVSDLITNTRVLIEENNLETLEDVMQYQVKTGRKPVGFSAKVKVQVAALKKFLFKNLYRHPEVVVMNVRAEKVIKRLFDFFVENLHALPTEYRERIHNQTAQRAVADFIAGMTDRYALRYNRDILGL